MGGVLCHGPRSLGEGVTGRATNKGTGLVHLVVTNLIEIAFFLRNGFDDSVWDCF